MIVGITFDLKDDYRALGWAEEEVAEFDGRDTIDAIAGVLEKLGHETVRIGHLQNLAARLAAGERWDFVFNIAEGAFGAARESQVPALLDAYEIPYTFSDPLVLGVCLDKQLAKLLVREHGVATPDWVLVKSPFDVASVDLRFPLFAKPVAEGSSRGVTAISRVDDRKKLVSLCTELLETYRQPVLVERYLPGREFTVGILGTGAQAQVLGVLEVVLVGDSEQGVYSYLSKQECDTMVDYRVKTDGDAVAAGELALAAYRALGCRDAGRIDVRLDEQGRPCFIEANPLAGLNPVTSDLPILATGLGQSYDSLIARIVASTCERVAVSPKKKAAARAAR